MNQNLSQKLQRLSTVQPQSAMGAYALPYQTYSPAQALDVICMFYQQAEPEEHKADLWQIFRLAVTNPQFLSLPPLDAERVVFEYEQLCSLIAATHSLYQ